jgi:hypothetical protein
MYGIGFGYGAIGATTVLSGGVKDGSFVIKVDTTKAGTTSSTQVNIPTSGAGYDVDVDWGDGTGLVNYSGTAPTMTKTYAVSGVYTVKFYPRTSGGLPRIYYNNAGDKLKILSIEQWGNNAWTTFSSAFHGCSNLVVNATDTPYTNNVTSMSSAFRACTSITSINLYNCNFASCTAWSTAVSAGAFSGCSNLVSVNFSGVTMRTSGTYDMQSLFLSCSSLTTITGWSSLNLSKCTNLQSSFQSCTSLTSFDMSGMNLSSCTTILAMFKDSTSINSVNMSNVDLSSCITFGNTGSVGMFYGANALTSVNMTGVTLNTTSNFTANSMFQKTSGTTEITIAGLDALAWGKCTVFNAFLQGTSTSTNDYSNFLIKLATVNTNTGISLHGGTSKYNSTATTSRLTLTSTRTWTITDGGLV